MNFTDVLKWVLEAKLEEQLALHAVLKCNVVDPAHAAQDAMRPAYGKQYTLDKNGVPVKVGVPGLGMAEFIATAEQGTAPPEAGRPLKPGRYKLQGLKKFHQAREEAYKFHRARAEAKKTKPPAKLYTPASEFSKRWWRRLQRSSQGMTAEQLAGIAGAKKRAKEVSTQLGTLYKRGIVDRMRLVNSTAFLYSVKETLP